MYAYLNGRFVNKSPAKAIVDINGIGFEVHISLHTYSHIQALEVGKLFTVHIVREDAHLLYGFFEETEKEIFLQLISVSGVGTSTARVMLSYMKPDELIAAIMLDNTKALESIKGIGKKTAERIVLELRDKVSRLPASNNILIPLGNTLAQDALEALIALGIAKPLAEGAIKKVNLVDNETVTLEELIKLALKNI